MFPKVLILLLLTSISLQKEPCDVTESVDISEGTRLSDGAIYYQGDRYDKTEYFYQNNTERGCLCLKKNCVRKCCDHGFAYDPSVKKCVSSVEVFDPPLWDGKGNIVKDHFVNSSFNFLFGKPECPDENEPRIRVSFNVTRLQSDGKLFINIDPPVLRGPDKYCVDTFVTTVGDVKEARLDALICFAEEKEEDRHRYILSACCMITSCVFLLITVGVYGWLPELRNLHGKVLMAYLVCLFFGFGFMATMQIMLMIGKIYSKTCLSLTILIYFFLESAFFWLNVMCFDIWWTFSGKRGPSGRLSSQTRFKVYTLYAFGLAAFLTVLLLSLEFSGIDNLYMPRLNNGSCFLAGASRLIYLYGPIVILCIVNLVFFILTAVKIAEIKKQTSVLKSKESSTHDVHRNDKQRLTLYVKLFAVMGINWILEVISAIYPDLDGFWKVTDTYNVLIGLIVFIIFVCKRKTLRLIKKRMGFIEPDAWERVGSRPTLKYRQLRGETMSRTQTTTSTRTVSSRDEIQMASIKNKV